LEYSNIPKNEYQTHPNLDTKNEYANKPQNEYANNPQNEYANKPTNE